MKKLLLALLILPMIAFAAPVSKNQARSIGENFFNKSIQVNRVHNRNAKLISLQHPNMKNIRRNIGDSYAPYYIFNNEDGGFVIVAGDDCATPILGYSTEGRIEPNNMPIQLVELLNAYAEEIQISVENNNQATDSIQMLWDAYERSPQSQNATAVVNTLISTSWDQYPWYNNRCPSDPSLSERGGHPTTGCVATAMAQIMRYWEHPKIGIGYHSYKSELYGTLSANFANTTYEWNNMPLKLSSSTSSVQNDAVATLMYQCGVAVDMNYNCDGRGSSAAYVVDYGYGRASAEKALATYFGYASTIAGKNSSSMTDNVWKNMLKSELDNKRPILYAGCSSERSGHAFICDGYDNNDKFHFNWGWGGTANGFFSLTALTPSNHNYSIDQQAVIGIKPNDGSRKKKKYNLYMNTDLVATNTSSQSSATEPNMYYFGNTLSFVAKVENNGTGGFDGSFKVGVFTNDGTFVSWSKESYHFSLGAGKVTEKQTFTFDGGIPFIPGKYRAYMYYQDDDETDSKLVKTDDGVILTEYNNVVFTIKSTGDLKPASEFKVVLGSFTTGSPIKIDVDVRNNALIQSFRGDIRLCLYDYEGKSAQIIDELNFDAGFPALTTKNLSFNNYIEVVPGTYYLALVYKETSQTSWYYMGCTNDYPNPIMVIVKAQELHADKNEVNNTLNKATNIIWEIDDEMQDFSTSQVSLHEETDIDYYKLSFPNSGKYKVNVYLYDKHNNLGMWYENADAKYSYSVGGNSFSQYYKDEQSIYFSGPTTLYLKAIPYGMNGLGYYELAGEIIEIMPRNECKVVPYTETFASSQGDFSVENLILPSGFSSIWNWDSQYGMVAKCIKGSTKYASESYLISPCIELPENGKTILTFSHAAKFFTNTSQLTLWISTNYDPSNLSIVTWEQLPIPTYPPGTNWTWYNSGEIDLSKYNGLYVNIAFRYTSTTDSAPQWEIKNFSIKQSLSPIDDILLEQQKTSKIILDGQIYIFRDGKMYNLQGVEVK